MPVITPVDLEPILHIDVGNNADPTIIAAIARAQDMVEGELGRRIEAETGIVETIDGTWASIVYLSRWPVTAITSIVENGVTLTGTDYQWTAKGKLRRVSGGYPKGWTSKTGSIVVTYSAGFPTGHVGYKELAGVVLRVAVRMFEAAAAFAARPAGTDGIDSESIGTYDVTYSQDADAEGSDSVANAFALTDEDLAIIKKWRVRLPGVA